MKFRKAVPSVISLLIFLFPLFDASAASAAAGEFAELVAKKGPAIRQVLDKPTLYRVAELPDLPVGKDTFEFLLDRPLLSLALARLSDPKMDKYQVEVRPDGSSHVRDRDILVGDMELISWAEGRRIYYISGYWDFMLGIRFNGRFLLVCDYAERPGSGGKAVDSRTRGFIKVDNALVGAIAKIIAYIFPGKVDARISRFANAVRSVAVAVHDDPAGVYQRLAASGEVGEADLKAYREHFLGGRT